MNNLGYRPELEGPITEYSLTYMLDSIPKSVDGEPAKVTGKTATGAIIFTRTATAKRRGEYTQRFTLLNVGGNVQIVPLVEDEKASAATPSKDLSLSGVDFASQEAADLAASKNLTATDFDVGAGSGSLGGFTLADVRAISVAKGGR